MRSSRLGLSGLLAAAAIAGLGTAGNAAAMVARNFGRSLVEPALPRGDRRSGYRNPYRHTGGRRPNPAGTKLLKLASKHRLGLGQPR